MTLASSILLILFHLGLSAYYCHADQSNVGNLLAPRTIHAQRFCTTSTSTAWRLIRRGGSNNSAPVIPTLEKIQQLPSLFQNESDIIYDRYAACLAATEGLRRIRDQTLNSLQQPCINDPLCTKRNIREAKQWAVVIYAERASKVIEAMGMPVSQFNSIGKVVCSDTNLKQKVLEQAYLYRLQSSVALDAIPTIDEQVSKPFRSISKEKFQRFCESMYNVEKLRRNLAEELKQKFQLTELPPLTSQASLRPLLDSNVRSAIDSFPVEASNVVHLFGLNNHEFNELLRKTNASVLFDGKFYETSERLSENKRTKSRLMYVISIAL